MDDQCDKLAAVQLNYILKVNVRVVMMCRGDEKKTEKWLNSAWDEWERYPYFWRYPNSLIKQCRIRLPAENQLDAFSSFDTMSAYDEQTDTGRQRNTTLCV